MRILLLLTVLSAPALAQDQIRITEWMYKGGGGEFFELTNVGAAPVDMTGWSFDDIDAVPGLVDLSPLGILAAGDSAIVTESAAAAFIAEWGLVGVAVLGDNTLANLKRNDAIHVFDAALALHDALNFGDEDYPGSPRTNAVSASACDEAIGDDFVWGWSLAEAGDAQGSVTSVSGDVGSPGAYVATPCGIYRYCGPAVPNSSGSSATILATGSFVAADNLLTLTALQLPPNQYGYFVTSQTQGFIAQPPGSEGNLCLSGPMGRFRTQLQNSGSAGEFSIPVDLTNIPMGPPHSVTAGERWNFTAWYRDMNPGATSNFTDAVSVLFE